ncbi:HAD family hydrolase [Gymnodinialimonas hymeniacidonis]|uniref:sulfotransferase-like domain-containing protein n=1 Tax=Gymnodinialimonas hymeniacidonis TaxID=3126508 RepID=UPI0034C5EEFA
MKIAMWSGPRNLSTAMMYAFGNRADCEAVDEPFYAAYLAESGADHPMREACIAAQPTDPEAVVAGLKPQSKPVHYLKMMTHHMLPDFPLDWAKDCVNVHLIRHPARVIASYTNKRDSVTMEDIGYAEVARIHAALPGPVIDSADVREDPEGMLKLLCKTIGLGFDPAMLSWPQGPKEFDGAWAPHWYDAVHRSTGFAPAEGELPEITEDHGPLLEAAMPIYEALRAKRLRT